MRSFSSACAGTGKVQRGKCGVFNEGKTSLLQSRAVNWVQKQLTGKCGKWATGCSLATLEWRDGNAMEAEMHRVKLLPAVNYCLIFHLWLGGTA